MKLETKSFAFELKSVSEDGGTFEGHGACYLNIDGGGDIIDPDAYSKHMEFFRKEGKIRDEHMVTTGKIADATGAGSSLYIKANVSDTAAGRDQKILLRDRVLTRLSVGHVVIARQWLETPEEVKSYWNSKGYTPTEQDLIRCGNGVRLITEARPVEVSTTFNPMNEKCAITGVKSASGQPAGLTFDAHSDHTLAVLEEFLGRATRLAEKRSADGRTLSPKHLATFRRLADGLASLQEKAKPPTPAEAPDPAEAARRLHAEFLHLCAALNGV